ncbi:MAG: TetR/AcrR family transcriptional regulator [Lactobacillus sp.]|nr:TetR/AcrR family transcriptional regulator [Lactobacillus sp.]
MAYSHAKTVTKKALEHSLIKLLVDKPLDAISVNEITTGARLTRSSFYRYFDDKYDLVESIEKDLLQEMVEAHIERNPFALNGGAMATGLKFYRKRADRFASLLGPNGDRSFEYKIKKQLSKDFDQQYAWEDLTLKERYLEDAMLDLGMNMVKFWVTNPAMSEADMVEVIYGIMESGPTATMKKLLNES